MQSGTLLNENGESDAKVKFKAACLKCFGSLLNDKLCAHFPTLAEENPTYCCHHIFFIYLPFCLKGLLEMLSLEIKKADI